MYSILTMGFDSIIPTPDIPIPTMIDNTPKKNNTPLPIELPIIKHLLLG